MACKLVVLAVIVFLGFAHTLPVDIDQDTEFVPRNVYRHASRTSPASGSEVPNYAPGGFPGISFPDFTRIQEYFDAIRKRIAETFSSTFDGIDLDAGNKTSETRIINGNKVTINRTIYENDGVHYVVKNIQVRPLDETEDVEPEVTTSITRTATGVRDIESLDNEINREKSIDEVGKTMRKKRADLYGNAIEDFDTHFEPLTDDYKPMDLSSDTNVNYLTPNLPINPDAETFNPAPPKTKKNYYEYDISIPLPSLNGKSLNWVDLSHDIDVNKNLASRKPIFVNPDVEIFDLGPKERPKYDLSRDTYINQIASQRFPDYQNPDAEVFTQQVFRPQNGRPTLAPIRSKQYYSDGYYNEYQTYQTQEPVSLHRDVYVNRIAADNNYYKPHPDVEVFGPMRIGELSAAQQMVPSMVPTVPPVDLSRDTYVNEIARQRGRRIDEDVEIFDPRTFTSPKLQPIFYRPQSYQYADPRRK